MAINMLFQERENNAKNNATIKTNNAVVADTISKDNNSNEITSEPKNIILNSVI